MAKREFTREFMLGVLDEENGEIISDDIVDNSRWSIHHELIFKFEDKFYSAVYSVGATESQDESPWEYEETVKATEVVPVEKTVTVYEAVKEAA